MHDKAMARLIEWLKDHGISDEDIMNCLAYIAK